MNTMKRLDLIWESKYECLKEYIRGHHHLPSKKRVENRGLLNWWKYNQKRLRQGKLSEDQVAKLKELGEMRDM